LSQAFNRDTYQRLRSADDTVGLEKLNKSLMKFGVYV